MKNKFFSVVATLVLSFPFITRATSDSTGPGNIPIKLENPLVVNSLNDLLVAILNIVMVLMVPVIVFFIIYAGFLYVTARGNAEQVKSATRALTYAIIGAILIIGAFAIAQIIKATVDSFRPDEAKEITNLNYYL